MHEVAMISLPCPLATRPRASLGVYTVGEVTSAGRNLKPVILAEFGQSFQTSCMPIPPWRPLTSILSRLTRYIQTPKRQEASKHWQNIIRMASLSPKMNKRSVPSSPSDTADSRPTKKQVVDGLPAAAALSGQATASEEAAMNGPKEVEEEDEEGAMSAPVASTSTAPASAALNKAANPHGPKPRGQQGRDKKPKKDNKDWNAKKSNTWMSRNNEAKGTEGGSDDEGAVDGEGKKRLPKKKAAILIG